jgi:hypothetical protein
VCHSPVVHDALVRSWPTALRRQAVSPNVVVLALGLIVVHLLVRAWALYGGWFYTDDFRLLYEARNASLGLGHILQPYDSQLMPGGRFVAWVVEGSGNLNWAVAATLNLGLQALTSLACFLALRSWFGLRPAILAPLAFYLFTAMPVPALMWWAASLNQLPMQLSFFLALWAWVGYLRHPTVLGALASWGAVAFGLLFYVKALLVVPVLVFLALAYFARGSLLRRIREAAVKYWLGLAGLVAGAAAFSVYYVTRVPQLGSSPDVSTTLALLDTYAATSFTVSVLGGPWLWWQHPNPPTSQVDVPTVVVSLCWVVLALVAVTTALLRRRTLRAWFLVAAYLVASFALLVTSRGAVGAYVGLELRYLTDVAAVVTSAIGFAYLPVVRAVESSEPRPDPPLRFPQARPVGVSLLALVCLGGVLSTYGHARTWHTDNPGRTYLTNAVNEIEAQGTVVNIADHEAPPEVMIEWSYPHNLVSRMLPLTGAPVRFPDRAERLFTLDRGGTLHVAAVEPGVTDTGGEDPNCGWLVGTAGREIPLTGDVLGLEFWMRIAYLASADREVRLTMGAEEVDVALRKGLHDIFVRNDGGFDTVGIDGLEGEDALCVAEIEVGAVTLGELP